MARDCVTPNDPTLLLVNPASRNGRHSFAWYREQLEQRINLVDATLPESAEQLKGAIQQNIQRGVTRIIVGGGDGTLSMAVGEILDSPAVLGVLPLGTGNTFAYGLNLPSRPAALLDLLTSGPVVSHDVGEARTATARHIFLNSATVGLSERLARLLTHEAKKRWGLMAWPINVRKAIRATPPFQVDVTWDGGRAVYHTRQFVVVNGRNLAGPLKTTPQSSSRDALLEVFRLGGTSEWSMARVTWQLLRGKLLTEHDARYLTTRSVTFSTDPPVAVDLDGDVWEMPPVTCRVLPGVLPVITPLDPLPQVRPWTRMFGKRQAITAPSDND